MADGLLLSRNARVEAAQRVATLPWHTIAVAGATALGALLLVALLVQWAYALGRSELYGQLLAFRVSTDSLSQLCRQLPR